MIKTTICGIELSLFKNKPTPEEIAGLIVSLSIEEQADVIGWWGSLRSRNNLEERTIKLVNAIDAIDEDNADGSGMQLLNDLRTALNLFEQSRGINHAG